MAPRINGRREKIEEDTGGGTRREEVAPNLVRRSPGRHDSFDVNALTEMKQSFVAPNKVPPTSFTGLPQGRAACDASLPASYKPHVVPRRSKTVFAAGKAYAGEQCGTAGKAESDIPTHAEKKEDSDSAANFWKERSDQADPAAHRGYSDPWWRHGR
ncbi:hypothetical protein MTO96_007781 [Rhipicephalus appendiculatus]